MTYQNVCREVIVWKHLRHTNIVPLLGVSDIDGARYMISEWMTNGSVRDYANEQEASNKRRWELILDTVAGMEYLHSKEVIHGDLKSSNVLVNNGGRACITDFGLNAVKYNIRSINVATDIPGTGYYGTIQWMPPEYFDPDTAGITHPVQEGDIYSLAGVIWEIFTGEQPFFGVRNATVLSLRLLGEHPQRPSEHSAHGMSDRAWEILTRCWSTDRANRPAAYDLLADLRAEFQAQAPL
ncbi:kinase-like protein [Wolfiporia cocos MD-104 SS10]|uniref:Kinase-like protein n=1 Tax=Wolfiporia cocos (strain MD-104) TaxID=742152 RepID=A0A2H3J9E0_WOLCO|nr:kinase-like protein [Wolfiporia cocos MD-104 SS10]